MKRYWLFQFFKYEACGGMDDFTGSFDTIDEAMEKIDEEDKDPNGREFAHIVDSETGRKVVAAGITRKGNSK